MVEVNRARQQLDAVLTNPDATGPEMVAAVYEYISTLSAGVSANLQEILSRFEATDRVIEGARGAIFGELNRALADLEATRAEQEIRYLEEKSVLDAQQRDLKKLSAALERFAKLQRQYHRLKHGRGYEYIYAKLIVEKALSRAKETYDRLKKEYHERWGD